MAKCSLLSCPVRHNKSHSMCSWGSKHMIASSRVRCCSEMLHRVTICTVDTPMLSYWPWPCLGRSSQRKWELLLVAEPTSDIVHQIATSWVQVPAMLSHYSKHSCNVTQSQHLLEEERKQHGRLGRLSLKLLMLSMSCKCRAIWVSCPIHGELSLSYWCMTGIDRYMTCICDNI